MLLLCNSNLKNRIVRIIAVALFSIVSVIGVEGAFYSNSQVSAVDNNISYTMEFIGNTVENMPNNILDGLVAGDSLLISSNNPVRPPFRLGGFIFDGWCNQPTTKSGGNDACASGHSYQPGDAIPLDQTGANNIKLYAMWKKVQSSCPSSPMISTVAPGITYMQDIFWDVNSPSSIRSKLTVGLTYQIKDNRDDETYCVGKLADGKLWLLDNLALDLTNSTVLNGMDESNTNASNTILGYLKNGGGTTSDRYATSGVTNWLDLPHAYNVPMANLNYKDLVPNDSISIAGGYKVGGLYNYCAASAGSVCYGSGSLDEGTTYSNASQDICPQGWRMPTGKATGEYSALANVIYGSTGSTSSPTAYTYYRSALHLPLSGNYQGYSLADRQGSYGHFLSSTALNGSSIYRLTIDLNSINPTDTASRLVGYPIRCVYNY